MILVTFHYGNGLKLGLKQGDRVLDVAAAVRLLSRAMASRPLLPSSTRVG
jgi:hypothetical protein